MSKDNEQNTSEPDAQTLRKRGYLDIDDFVSALVPGLKEYLESNCALGKLSHPQDLVLSSTAYLETMYHVVGTFGVNPDTVKRTTVNRQ